MFMSWIILPNLKACKKFKKVSMKILGQKIGLGKKQICLKHDMSSRLNNEC